MAVLYDMYKQAPMFNWEQVDFFIVGFISAFISAYISVRWLLSFIKKHNFILFGFYRIAIALLFIPLFL
jgi:undecaprenyl-diphosphatase